MIILVIITTMIIIGWANLQRASANALRTNQRARLAARRHEPRLRGDACRAATRTAHRATASAAPIELLQVAEPMDVQFYSAFNADGANSDGSGTSGRCG